MTRFPIRCTWVATGNNPQVSNEIARRLIRIRLDPHVDRPWMREGFRHRNCWPGFARPPPPRRCLPDLGPRLDRLRPTEAPANTIGTSRTGSQVLAGILEVAGVPGFLANLGEIYEPRTPKARSGGRSWRTGGTGSAQPMSAAASVPTGACSRAARAARRRANGARRPASASRSGGCATGYSTSVSDRFVSSNAVSSSAPNAGGWRCWKATVNVVNVHPLVFPLN